MGAAGVDGRIIDNGLAVVDGVNERRPDVILLDLMLPGRRGLDVFADVRRIGNIPIVMVTARVEEVDRLVGLELGADDYICKPFSPREVVARVKAVLRRTRNDAQTPRPPPIELDQARFEARVLGKPVNLTPVEFRLLAKLMAQ